MKKWIAVILTIALLSMAACTSAPSTSTTQAATTAAPATTTAAPAATTAAPAATTAAAAANDNKLVTDPRANDPFISPIVNEPVTLSLGVSQSTNVIDYEDNYVTRWYEEKTGIVVKYDLFPSADAVTRLDLLVNSNSELPDILTFGLDNVRRFNYGKEGILIPLNEYYERLAEPFYKYAETVGVTGDDVLRFVVSADGNIYGAPFFDYNYNNLYSLRGWINKTWLDKLGLEAPKDSEELVKVLTAFRDQDPNGNGQADEIPMMGSTRSWNANALGWLMNMFIYYNGNNNFYQPLNETGGKIDVAYDKDAFREFLKYANNLVAEGLLSPLSFTQDGAQYNATKSASPPILGLSISGGANEFYLDQNDDEYIPFEALKGPGGKQYYTTFPPSAYSSCAITKYCDSPEIAFLYMNYTYYDDDAYEGQVSKRFGEKDVDWRYALPGEESFHPGQAPFLHVIETQWGVPNNKNIAGVWLSNVVDPRKLFEVFDGSTSNPEYWYAKNYTINKDHGIPFDQLPVVFLYTEDEVARWVDQRTALQEYVNESMTLFAMGQMDPNNDSDWNKYIQELNNLQYKDILAADQVAFERGRQ